MQALVSTGWLADAIGTQDLRLLDATLFLPGDPRDARAEYGAGHIAGARFMDLDGLSDPGSALPHMMPPAPAFAEAMEALGISGDDRIVIYDNSPLHSAARAWWMLRACGATRVAILDGGMQKWLAEGRPVTGDVPPLVRGRFAARPGTARFVDKSAVQAILREESHGIVDARSAARFTGEAPEPRAGLASGHVPGSANLPQDRLFAPDNSFLAPHRLAEVFADAGVDLSRPLVTTCGSGITAAVLAFAAHLIGKDDVSLYDGSWAEWGADPDTPKALGRP